ncbi:MAG: HAD-IIA family hydrolase [Candidatus Heimdallarchaeota archaeon]
MIRTEIATKKALFIDVDGVIWHGNRMIEGVNETITELQRSKKVIFITNNSTLTRLQYQARLTQLGIHTTMEEIMTSGYAAAMYLAGKARGARIFLIGEEGLKSELEQCGYKVVEEYTQSEINFVLVGLDRYFTYNKLAHAMTAILNGARFLATNADAQLPAERGLLPGAGSIVSALSTCSGKTPEIVFGKPNSFLLELSLKHLGLQAQDAAMVGDRIETDVLAAKKLNMFSILVLSGVTSQEKLRTSDVTPDLVLNTINDLLE